MSISKKERSKSRKQPLIDEQMPLLDKQIPWPENPDSYVVARKRIEDFIGNQTLGETQTTAKRFLIVPDAGRAIGRGELASLNWRRLLRYTTSLDKSEACQIIMESR